MRIIGGKYKGQRLAAPELPDTRPTTDLARESLFNILEHLFETENCVALDLFCGTGSIAFELISRGAKEVTAVDLHPKALQFMREQAAKWQAPVRIVKSDVFRFLLLNKYKYDLIFADPPYNNKHIAEIPEYVFSKKMLNPNGILIVEHGKETQLHLLPGYQETRQYGRVHFSFFQNAE